MVQRCCVPLCETKVGTSDTNGAKIRFHRIPLIREKFLQWRDQITNFGQHKPEPELTQNSRICSKHFLRSDYITVEEQKPGTSGNHVLAKNALPTIFKWNDEFQSKISRAIPYMKKADALNELKLSVKNQEVQCCNEIEEKLRQELHRKNIVIKQLLQRLAELEEQTAPGKDTIGSPQIPKFRDSSIKILHSETNNCNIPVNHFRADPSHASTSTQTHKDIEESQVVPQIPAQLLQQMRPSVIKRMHRNASTNTCIESIDNIAKPPKKRSYFFPNVQD